MNIDLSRLSPQKREAAQGILDSLNGIDEAAATQRSALCKEKRDRITKELEELIGASLEKQIEISKLSDEVWHSVCYRILAEFSDPFVPKNKYDLTFHSIIKLSFETDSEALFEMIRNAVCNLKEQSRESYNIFVDYFARFPLWGTLDPERNDFDTLRRRAAVIKQHSYDFMWLYRRFPDYLSKYTLIAILLNWTSLDMAHLRVVKSIFQDYYELDIFPDNKDDVFVDVGAFTGDSILNYIESYGTDYKKIYAYEITRDSCEKMRHVLKNMPNIEIRRKGVGDKAGEMFLSVSESDQSANQLSEISNGERVEIVKLDDDLPDGFTFLKMDIEGAEYDALRGAEQTIRRCRPKLAVCVYHGYDDIWRIPALIDSIDPDYTFYLRHNGGNLIPTEFVLLCKPAK